MHLLYTDEVNVNPQNSEFFIYAGVAVSDAAAQALSEEIGAIRQKLGYKPGDVLKFNTVERPTHIGPDAHREAKRLVMEGAAQHEVKLLASFILHSVATSPDEARRNEINRICFHFNCFLVREKDDGLVLVDPFTDSLGHLADHLREKFSVGLESHAAVRAEGGPVAAAPPDWPPRALRREHPARFHEGGCRGQPDFIKADAEVKPGLLDGLADVQDVASPTGFEPVS